MTVWIRATAAVLALVGFTTAALAEGLPRRGVLGLVLTSQPGIGLTVVNVINPAAENIQKDDLLVAVNGKNVDSPYAISLVLDSPAKAGESVLLRLRRGGEEFSQALTLMSAPAPQLDGRALELGEAVLSGGARVRTYLARPVSDALSRDGKAPAVMIVPGIPCQTEEVFGNVNHPMTKLYQRLTQSGFAVYVADKPGVGDSEGGPCKKGGFNIEIEAFTAAARKLRETQGVDPERLFAIGISMGGVQAPLIAGEAGFKGIITWGTVVMPWHDYLIATFRRRAVLEGQSLTAAEPMLRNFRKIAAAMFVDGLTRAEIKQKMPDTLKAIEDWGGNIEDWGTRSVKFAQETDKANVGAAWQAYTGKLLALHGEYDWVAEDYDHALAVHIVNARQPGAASFEVLKGLDHAWTRHATLAESFAKPFQGAPDDQFELRATAWLLEQAKL